QFIAGVAVIVVLHHDEPALERLCMADGTGRHFSCVRLEHFFYERRTIRESSVPAIGDDSPGRRIDVVNLLRSLALVSCYSPGSKELIDRAIVIGYVQIPICIDYVVNL